MIHHTTFSSIMTYQQRTQTHNDDDTVEEASSLLTSVTASPAPARSFSFGQGGGGVPATQKKNGVSMRTTSVLLGTLAVIYGGRDSSSHISSGGILFGGSASGLRSKAGLLFYGHR